MYALIGFACFTLSLFNPFILHLTCTARGYAYTHTNIYNIIIYCNLFILLCVVAFSWRACNRVYVQSDSPKA